MRTITFILFLIGCLVIAAQSSIPSSVLVNAQAQQILHNIIYVSSNQQSGAGHKTSGGDDDIKNNGVSTSSGTNSGAGSSNDGNSKHEPGSVINEGSSTGKGQNKGTTTTSHQPGAVVVKSTSSKSTPPSSFQNPRLVPPQQGVLLQASSANAPKSSTLQGQQQQQQACIIQSTCGILTVVVSVVGLVAPVKNVQSIEGIQVPGAGTSERANVGKPASSFFIMNVTGNHPSLTSFPGNQTGTLVSLLPGAYNVSEENKINGYNVSRSSECSGIITAGETKNCNVTIQQQSIQ